MNYVDFHTHLDWYNQDELMLQLEKFSGIIVAASVDAGSFLKNQRISEAASKFNCRIIPTVGIHPKNAAEAPENLSVYDEFCKKSPLIGEIGMDFCWYKDASPEKQEQVFRYFLNHCNEYEKYCVIHTKDAESQVVRILEDYPKAKPVIHWYDGPEEIFQEFCHRGYYQTFGCETIRSKHIQKLLCQTPLELILAETDNPDSEPWLGGNDNSVKLIERVYSDIGKVLGMETGEVSELINKNSSRILNGLFPAEK